jgi:hypothetical protein
MHGLSPNFHIHVYVKDFPREQGWHPSLLGVAPVLLPHSKMGLRLRGLALYHHNRMTSTSPGTKTLTEALPMKKTMTPNSYRTTTSNPAWHPVYHLLVLLCQMTVCGFRASLFRLCPICFKKWHCYRDATCLYCKRDPANKQRLSDIMTYRANIDYEFMMYETEEEN